MGKPRGQSKALRGEHRAKLLEELHLRYGVSGGVWSHAVYLRKKYSWLLVVLGVRALKRAIDTIVSLMALVILSPVFVLIGLIIKVSDGGPMLYIDYRVGKWGREFLLPKFRTMRVDAPDLKETLADQNHHETGVTFKMKEDPRVTRIGRFLRKSSLDELPQLWCVLRGQMSLVGPRPPLPEEVAEYTLEERRRLDVKPGLTCIWQVSGRSNLAFDKQVRLDIQYIESQSFWLDLKLLLKTIPAVLFGRGAY